MKTRLPKALLAALSVMGTSFAASDGYNFTDYNTFSHSVSADKAVVITVGNGDYSAFDMYHKTTDKYQHYDDGIIIGGATTEDKPVYNQPADNGSAKSVSITLNGGTGINYILGIGSISCAVSGAIDILVESGEVGCIVGGYMYYSRLNATTSSKVNAYPDKSPDNDVTITVTGGTVGGIYGGHLFRGNNPTTLEPFKSATEAEKAALLADKPWAIGGNIKIAVTGGTVGGINAVGSPKSSVDGNSTVEISGGTVTGSVVAGPLGEYAVVGGDTSVVISGDAVIEGSVLTGSTADSDRGSGPAPTVNGNAGIIIKDNAHVKGDVYAAGSGTNVKGNVTVYLQDNATIDGQLFGEAINGGTVGKESILYVGTDEQGYNGSVGGFGNFDHVVVHEKSDFTISAGNVFDVSSYTYRITRNHLTTAATELGSEATVDVNAPVSINILKDAHLRSGRYMLIDATAATVDTTHWTAENVTVTGADFYDLEWQGNVLTFVYRGAEVDAILNSNWGLFKSAQAFTGTLWGNRANAVALNTGITTSTDEKGSLVSFSAPTGTTLAWGTAYGHYSRLDSSRSTSGADFSLYGAAAGVEHHFVSGQSIGAALGCDTGEVSPFNAADSDQKTTHLGLYGRAINARISQQGRIVLDWSVAYGRTSTESDTLPGNWEQQSLQVDARASYLHQLSESTCGYIFAGLQYYAADADTANDITLSSMQNLRTEIGVGISHELTQKATLYAEASLYNDTMRHNPDVRTNGAIFTGANPGRLGGSITVGASYDLNADWTLRGSYSFEGARHSTGHSVNAGASYKF